MLELVQLHVQTIIPYKQIKKSLPATPAGAGNIARIAAGYAGHAGRPNLWQPAIGRRGRLWGALCKQILSRSNFCTFWDQVYCNLQASPLHLNLI